VDGWANGADLPIHHRIDALLKLALVDWAMFTEVIAQNIMQVTMEQARPIAKFLRTSTTREGWFTFMQCFLSTDVSHFLPEIQCPTLVIHTGRSRMTGDGEESLSLASQIPGARLATLHSPHFPLGDTTDVIAAIEDFLARDDDGSRSWSVLSAREKEALLLVSKGLTNREIAEALVVAPATVARHVHNILTKLGFDNRTAAAAWASAHPPAP
jgi:DNA-binding CsgD family transcriptional regulator